MYAIVGCSDCAHLWLLEGRPETSQCPRCGSRKPRERRRTFLETDDLDHARDVRASMLANRSGHGDTVADLDSFADLEKSVEDGVLDEATYLEASGLDTDAIEAAGERDPRVSSRQGSKKEIVEEALATLEEPTEDEVIAYAAERGVDAEYVERALEKLTRAGAVSESRGRYRLV